MTIYSYYCSTIIIGNTFICVYLCTALQIRVCFTPHCQRVFFSPGCDLHYSHLCSFEVFVLLLSISRTERSCLNCLFDQNVALKHYTSSLFLVYWCSAVEMFPSVSSMIIFSMPWNLLGWHVSSMRPCVFVNSLRIKFTHLSVWLSQWWGDLDATSLSAAYELFASVHLLPAPDRVQLVRSQSSSHRLLLWRRMDHLFIHLLIYSSVFV